MAFRKAHPTKWPEPRTLYPGNNPLGKWCVDQKKAYREGRLSRKELRKFLRIWFPIFADKLFWEMLPRKSFKDDETWLFRFEDLREYRRRFPNRWPQHYDRSKNSADLGKWLHINRVGMSRGTIRPEFRSLLSSLGFGEDIRADNWERQFQILLELRKSHPHRWPKVGEEFPAGNQLGYWLANQCLFRSMGRLKPEREQKLRAIGYVFPKPLDEIWMERYQSLLAFRRKHKDRWLGPREEFPKGHTLGAWCSLQRLKGDRLPADRKALLDKIGFPFGKQFEFRWEDCFEKLKRFRKEYPNRGPRRREDYPRGYQLGYWLHAQIFLFRRGKLPKDKEKRLLALGFPFGVERKAKWEKVFNALREFYRKRGHWPSHKGRSKEEKSLRYWSVAQRERFRRGALEASREKRLLAIGFDLDPRGMTGRKNKAKNRPRR